ncbi:hypothetical protein DFJ73DRAFT_846285 [Zopfochytrium polystomum]|nr:hypothetical protein DFJ73DRAFT_846285 [Zopfochytrium polystomum]
MSPRSTPSFCRAFFFFSLFPHTPPFRSVTEQARRGPPLHFPPTLLPCFILSICSFFILCRLPSYSLHLCTGPPTSPPMHSLLFSHNSFADKFLSLFFCGPFFPVFAVLIDVPL